MYSKSSVLDRSTAGSNDCPRLRVRLWVVDRDLDVHCDRSLAGGERLRKAGDDLLCGDIGRELRGGIVRNVARSNSGFTASSVISSDIMPAISARGGEWT